MTPPDTPASRLRGLAQEKVLTVQMYAINGEARHPLTLTERWIAQILAIVDQLEGH
jgi:hypothetical protein